jgi:hypothetical protein
MTTRFRIKTISTAEAETFDALVCREWTSPPLLPDNHVGQCAVCKCLVQHRPDAPRAPMRVCVQCAPAVIRRQ